MSLAWPFSAPSSHVAQTQSWDSGRARPPPWSQPVWQSAGQGCQLSLGFQGRGTKHYGLIVVGHSLGAGTAAILSFLLRPQYPTLKCFAYSPPGGLLR